MGNPVARRLASSLVQKHALHVSHRRNLQASQVGRLQRSQRKVNIREAQEWHACVGREEELVVLRGVGIAFARGCSLSEAPLSVATPSFLLMGEERTPGWEWHACVSREGELAALCGAGIAFACGCSCEAPLHLLLSCQT